MDGQGDDAVSFSSKGSTISGWGRRRMTKNDKRTAIWRQLYLSRAKLKAVSRTSALLAGFAMIAMVEVQLETEVNYPPYLLIPFTTVTTCLVSVHLFALMISTCLLPNIEAISNIHSLDAAKYSPHVKMRAYVELSWILSTGIGLILFLVEIALLIWLKLYAMCCQSKECFNGGGANNSTADCQKECQETVRNAGISGMAVLVPATLLFAGFAFHFYRSLAQHKYGVFDSVMREISDLEKRQDDMASHLRQPSVLEDRIYAHQDLSRLHSAASGATVQFRTNGNTYSRDHLSADSFLHENENSHSGRTTPSVEIYPEKNM